MQPVTLALALFPLLSLADFTMWSGTCTTGFNEDTDTWDNFGISTDSQGGCGGCSSGDPSSEQDFSGGNPCNGDCGADMLDFKWQGGTYDIIVRNTGIKVGYCEPTTGNFAACSSWNYSCVNTPLYRCHTYYCN